MRYLQKRLLHQPHWYLWGLQLQLHFLQEQCCLHGLPPWLHPDGRFQWRPLSGMPASLCYLPKRTRLLHLLRWRLHQEGLEMQEQHLHRLQVRPPGSLRWRCHECYRHHCRPYPHPSRRKLKQHWSCHLRKHYHRLNRSSRHCLHNWLHLRLYWFNYLGFRISKRHSWSWLFSHRNWNNCLRSIKHSNWRRRHQHWVDSWISSGPDCRSCDCDNRDRGGEEKKGGDSAADLSWQQCGGGASWRQGFRKLWPGNRSQSWNSRLLLEMIDSYYQLLHTGFVLH